MSVQSQVSFQGVWIPLVTPLRDGMPDGAALRRLVRHYAQQGVAGFVVCGSTGEAAALEEDEQLFVLDATLETAGGLPVIMGLSGASQPRLLRRLAALRGRPLAGVLSAAPAYVRPGQAGAMSHFLALADTAHVPLVLYDIPYRTGTTLDTGTLLALAEHPNIAAIKDCGGSLDKTLALIAHGGLQVLAGEDMQAFGTVALGGAGLIAAAAHVRADLYVAMYRALRAQQLDVARRICHALAPMIRLLYAEPNPAPLKALLSRQGWVCDELRAPMMRAAPALGPQLEAAAAELDRLYPPAA